MGVDVKMIKEIKRFEIDEATTKELIDMLNRKLYTVIDLEQEIDCCLYGRRVTTKAVLEFGEYEITIKKGGY